MVSEQFKKTKKPAAAWLQPVDMAIGLKLSMDADHAGAPLDPQETGDLLTMARWGRPFGLFERDVRAGRLATGEEADPRPRLPDGEIADWIRTEVSPHPERFREVAEACRLVQRRFLQAQVDRLETCGKVWWSQHVIRVFWKDSKGRERLRRQVGIHRCKQAWCPTCGRTRQAQLTAEVERIMILARDFGMDEGHARLVTLTVPNGRDISTLREQAHTAFAKLQRTRWWNRNAFGWIRGSEVVTGKDGQWNLHIHLLAIFWSPRVSYSELGRVWTQELGGLREGGKRFVLDCMSLEAYRWERKDGKNGILKRKGGLVRAARYITKYLTKAEEITNLKGGPGGLAHLFGATNGMRKFAVGGGCSVLRRAAAVLLPNRAFQAEEALAGTYLHQGRAPWRVEELDPETGEVRDVPADRLEDGRKRALEAWGEALETNPLPKRGQALPGRVVGIPEGPKGRYRRLGHTPLAGRGATVKAFEKLGVGALTGARALIAGGDWKVYRWWEPSTKNGKALKFAAVLPRVRYAWRPIREAMLEQLAHGTDEWAGMRSKANQAGAVHLVQGEDRRDVLRAVFQGLSDTDHRGAKAAELWEDYLKEMSTNPLAVWNDATQAKRRNALELESPGLLDLETPVTRQLRRDLESSF